MKVNQITVYITRCSKTVPYHTRREIQFTAEHQSYILVLPRHIKHMAIDGQVCFYRQLLLSLSSHEDALQVPWSQRMALLRMWVVLNCCQWLSWPILWIVSVSVTHWRHNVTACVLMEDITHNYPPFTTTLLPSHMYHSWYYSGCDQKSNSVSYLTGISYNRLAKRLHSSYIVNLAWLQSSTRGLQWVQCFKFVKYQMDDLEQFLQIQSLITFKVGSYVSNIMSLQN